jgi:hypothetical protein
LLTSKLEVMGSSISDNYLLFDVLNSLTSVYKERIGEREIPLHIEKLIVKLSLRLDKVLMKPEQSEHQDLGEEKPLTIIEIKKKGQE